MFFTYDNRYPPTKVGLYAEGAYNADIVTIGSDGTVSVLESTQKNSSQVFYKTLTSTDGDYVCIRITPQSDAHITAISMNSIEGGVNQTYYLQPCVEHFGYLPNCTQFGKGYAYRKWETRNLVSDTILGMGTVTRFDGYGYADVLVNVDIRGTVPLPTQCFRNCRQLRYFNITADTSNTANFNYMFDGCFRLKEIDISKWDMSGQKTYTALFNAMSALEEVKFPSKAMAPTDTGALFLNCSSIKKIKIPSNIDCSGVTSSTSQMFTNCTALEEIDLPSTFTQVIGNSFANGATSLKRVVLRANSVVSLPTTTNMFQVELFSAKVLKIVVPQAQLANYKTATNWSTLYATYGDDMFMTIEGSEWE